MMKKAETVISVRITKEMQKKLKALAEKRAVPFATLARMLLKQALDKEKDTTTKRRT